jgi:hypothetical protein
MAAWRRCTSALKAALWLVRGAGLRTCLQQLDDKVARLGHRLDESAVQLGNRFDQAAHRFLEFQERERQLSEQFDRLRARDLRAFERKVFSQNGEDGILQEIFHRIGVKTRYFVEFGVESGSECNCARLALHEGWQGLFMEADSSHFAALRERYRSYPGVYCHQTAVTSDNVEQLFAARAVPHTFDVLSIDIDGNDYWVWQAIQNWRPRVVVIEYNASHTPDRRWVMRENNAHRWDGTTYYGASLASLTALGRKKGYALVGTNSTGVNAFFVREELATPDRFPDPTVFWYYSPPNYAPHYREHPPGSGPAVEL